MWKRIKNWLKQYKALVNCVHIVRAAGEGSYLVCCVRDYTSSKIIRKVIKILVTPFCMVRYFFRRDIAGREGLAFVLIAKNEALYIKEWLDFHLKQGVSHFFIYDNESTDNFREVLEPYINSGVVTYRFLKGHPRQSDAYNMALVKNRRKFKYMGFIDADEFVFIRNSTGGGYK